jgi:hypothetical protein
VPPPGCVEEGFDDPRIATDARAAVAVPPPSLVLDVEDRTDRDHPDTRADCTRRGGGEQSTDGITSPSRTSSAPCAAGRRDCDQRRGAVGAELFDEFGWQLRIGREWNSELFGLSDFSELAAIQSRIGSRGSLSS